MKKNCIVYGNCQIEPLRDYLTSSKAFNSLYNMIYIPAVYLCNHEKGLEQQYLDQLHQCDLFIYQKVGKSYSYYLSSDYIMSKLPVTCEKISFANSYFSGYFPQYADKEPVPYADRNIIKLLNEGKSKEEIISILSDEDFYSYDEVWENLHATLQEQRRRDLELDIPLDDFIERNYKDMHLFFTINHPSHHVIRYLAMKILNKLGLPVNEISTVDHDSYFKDNRHPIYPSVIKHLNLSFINPEDKKFVLYFTPVTFREYIAKHIDILKGINTKNNTRKKILHFNNKIRRRNQRILPTPGKNRVLQQRKIPRMQRIRKPIQNKNIRTLPRNNRLILMRMRSRMLNKIRLIQMRMRNRLFRNKRLRRR